VFEGPGLGRALNNLDAAGAACGLLDPAEPRVATPSATAACIVVIMTPLPTPAASSRALARIRARRLCRLDALELPSTIPSTISMPAHCSSVHAAYCSAVTGSCIQAECDHVAGSPKNGPSPGSGHDAAGRAPMHAQDQPHRGSAVNLPNEPPELTPGAARALLHLLLADARRKDDPQDES
jgi:hypothetical protein